MNDERFLSLALAIPAVQTYNVFLPSIYEVENENTGTDEEKARGIWRNLYICDGIVLVAGIVTAAYVGDTLPVFVAVFVAAYMTLAYRVAIATEGTGERGHGNATADSDQ